MLIFVNISPLNSQHHLRAEIQSKPVLTLGKPVSSRTYVTPLRFKNDMETRAGSWLDLVSSVKVSAFFFFFDNLVMSTFGFYFIINRVKLRQHLHIMFSANHTRSVIYQETTQMRFRDLDIRLKKTFCKMIPY